jgi:hypothetical protein
MDKLEQTPADIDFTPVEKQKPEVISRADIDQISLEACDKPEFQQAVKDAGPARVTAITKVRELLRDHFPQLNEAKAQLHRNSEPESVDSQDSGKETRLHEANFVAAMQIVEVLFKKPVKNELENEKDK